MSLAVPSQDLTVASHLHSDLVLGPQVCRWQGHGQDRLPRVTSAEAGSCHSLPAATQLFRDTELSVSTHRAWLSLTASGSQWLEGAERNEARAPRWEGA